MLCFVFLFQLRWASSPAAVLGHLAGIDIQDILPDLDVHHPANTLMADSGPHDLFKQLELWLTPSLVSTRVFSPLPAW